MSDELETPQEHVEEEIHEHAKESKERWVLFVALFAALISVSAAVTSLLAGHQEHEAMKDTVQSASKWSYYQAEGIKQSILEGRIDELDNRPDKAKEVTALIAKVAEYKDKRTEINDEARRIDRDAGWHDHYHFIYSLGVTFFQVAIAISAISIITKRKAFFVFGILLSTAGYLMLFGALMG